MDYLSNSQSQLEGGCVIYYCTDYFMIDWPSVEKAMFYTDCKTSILVYAKNTKAEARGWHMTMLNS